MVCFGQGFFAFSLPRIHETEIGGAGTGPLARPRWLRLAWLGGPVPVRLAGR